MMTDIISYRMADLVHIFLFVAYGLVVLLCVMETMLEILRSGADWDRWKALGLALSVAWPVLLLLLILSYLTGKRSDRRAAAWGKVVD